MTTNICSGIIQITNKHSIKFGGVNYDKEKKNDEKETYYGRDRFGADGDKDDEPCICKKAGKKKTVYVTVGYYGSVWSIAKANSSKIRREKAY